MINGYDILYGLGAAITAPFWLLKPTARRKVLLALGQRMGHVPNRDGSGAAILIHAVSLGEINATLALVKLLQQARPELQIMVSTTTETGYERGRQLYGSMAGVTLVRFPLDFTGAIDRLLDAVWPAVVVLMELELWPNFLLQCEKREIPVALINGRMTPTAFGRYGLAKPIAGKMLLRLAVICAQDEVYADRFRKLGAPADRVQVTGTMKFDTATILDHVNGDAQLAADVEIKRGSELVWVCGSTGPGEEIILLETYRRLLAEFPNLRLVIVPRKPERFDEVAKLIEPTGLGLLRRSKPGSVSPVARPVILGDTMGELRKFYSLANVVFVGRSLVNLGPRQHGSDMIEPASLAKPIVVGPWTGNFAEAVRKLMEAKGLFEVKNGILLGEIIREWLKDPKQAMEIGKRAQQVVQENQGATNRHAEIILRLLV